MKRLTCQCIRTLSEITSAEHCLFCGMCPRLLNFFQGWIQDWWDLKVKRYGGDFLKFLFYSSIVNLQCCVNFCCTAKWSSYTYLYIFSHILFLYDLSQDIEYSSLCYTVGPYCLSILYLPLILYPVQLPHAGWVQPPPLRSHRPHATLLTKHLSWCFPLQLWAPWRSRQLLFFRSLVYSSGSDTQHVSWKRFVELGLGFTSKNDNLCKSFVKTALGIFLHWFSGTCK